MCVWETWDLPCFYFPPFSWYRFLTLVTCLRRNQTRVLRFWMYRLTTKVDQLWLSSRWLFNGGVTSDLIHGENGRCFLTPRVCAGCLLQGWRQLAPVSPEEFGLSSARAKAFARAELIVSRNPPDLLEQGANPLIGNPHKQWRQKTSPVFDGSGYTVIESPWFSAFTATTELRFGKLRFSQPRYGAPP